ncbi:MAG: hypothetical protein K5761_01190 [Clostridiales bacterium]|nr:hypothetical protein [Clostridiales bacterium]
MDPIEARKCPVCGNFFYDNGHGVCDDCYEADRQIPFSEILKKRQKQAGKSEETDEKTAETGNSAEAESVPETAEPEVESEDMPADGESENAPDELHENGDDEEITYDITRFETDDAYDLTSFETDEDDSDMKIFGSTEKEENVSDDEENEPPARKKKKGAKKFFTRLLVFILIVLVLALIAYIIYAKEYKPMADGLEKGKKYEAKKEYRLAFDEFYKIANNKEDSFLTLSIYTEADVHIKSVAQAMMDEKDYENLYECSKEYPSIPLQLKNIKGEDLEDFYDFMDARLLSIVSEERAQMVEDAETFKAIITVIPEQYDKYSEYSDVINCINVSHSHYPDNEYLFHMDIAEQLSDAVKSSPHKYELYKRILQQSSYMEFFLSGETQKDRLPAEGEQKYNCFWVDSDLAYKQNKLTVYKEKESDKKFKYELSGKFFEDSVEGSENDSFTVQEGNFYADGKKEAFSVEIINYYTIEIKSIETGETIELTRRV